MSETRPISKRISPAAKRDQLHLNLVGLGEGLREHARRSHLSLSCAARMAIAQMLEAGSAAAATGLCDDDVGQRNSVRVLLRLSPACAAELLKRARASGVSRSHYVKALMDHGQLAALPVDHPAMIAALTKSTDHIAAMSVDLLAFLRLLRTADSAKLEPYRIRLQSLNDDVLTHLRLAASLMAELESTRRWR
ncbi:hypothetical protein [Roseateles saccharophilus]|uniref:Uncharacterized protein n=1 Tax=Roseateles saccharophilus TaxID=304 RepID=A0A4V2VPC1_ROSSA|nr:hypothetical protein [Roseateles saccharophilus]MDG0834867.1 hypothetical protein [Roseateles saccharophilus]TCU88401.1 hypothetical protein EV671_103927 [Roseateles saccharophilus]